MYVVIAIHYPKPEHIEDFLAFMTKVESAAHGSPGMLQIGSCVRMEVSVSSAFRCRSLKNLSRRRFHRS